MQLPQVGIDAHTAAQAASSARAQCAGIEDIRKPSRFHAVEWSLGSSAISGMGLLRGLSIKEERGPPPPHRDTGARERARWSLDRRFAARSLVTSVVSAALARKMADVRHRGSVLRRLILALPEIRAPERALAPPAREGLRNARNPAQMSDLGAPNPRDARNRKRRRGRRK